MTGQQNYKLEQVRSSKLHAGTLKLSSRSLWDENRPAGETKNPCVESKTYPLICGEFPIPPSKLTESIRGGSKPNKYIQSLTSKLSQDKLRQWVNLWSLMSRLCREGLKWHCCAGVLFWRRRAEIPRISQQILPPTNWSSHSVTHQLNHILSPKPITNDPLLLMLSVWVWANALSAN